MENKLIKMTQMLINFTILKKAVLVRIDSQFNYNTYSWKAIGYAADGREFEVTDDFNASERR